MTLRLLADDLTGALDSASRFVPLVGPVPVSWRTDDLPPTAAIDAGTRDLDAAAARYALERLAPHLQGAGIAFKKIDSLLRGHVAVELAACMQHFDHCVLAPAFPFQGRITRGGQQLARDGDGWRDCGIDLPAALRSYGLAIAMRDAATDADLDAIVAAGRALPGRVLWCGTGGLAGALAGSRVVPCPPLPRPFLALIGSDHSVSATQLAATGDRLHRMVGAGTRVAGTHAAGGSKAATNPAGANAAGANGARTREADSFGTNGAPADTVSANETAAAAIGRNEGGTNEGGTNQPVPIGAKQIAALRRSLQSGAAAVCVALPDGTERGEATRRIDGCFAALLAAIERPGTLVVSGGETLRRLCDSLGVARLEVDGEVAPGVPASILRGGAWDGQRIVSKSGAFGDAGFLARLFEG